MNVKAELYWNEFWQGKDEEKPQAVSAWQFGADPDYLAQLVMDGIKRLRALGMFFMKRKMNHYHP